MQVLIEIPDEEYKKISNSNPSYADDFSIYYAIKNGTPLPKGHGRILDEKDILDTENNNGGWYDLVDMPEYIAGVKAIIEADKESEDKISSKSLCDSCITDGCIFQSGIVRKNCDFYKSGRWIEERTYMECPNCHDIWHYEKNQTERFKFCPTCGKRGKR